MNTALQKLRALSAIEIVDNGNETDVQNGLITYSLTNTRWTFGN